jgi:CO/xanthine dehydrogenase Mo-binding subunit
MAAQRLAIDPVQLRLRNLIRADELPYRVASGIVWDRSAFIDSLTGACQAARYQLLREEQAKARAEGRLAGIGIATYGTDRHRVSYFGGTGDADQHRNGNRHDPPRFDRCGDRQFRGCLTRPRA